LRPKSQRSNRKCNYQLVFHTYDNIFTSFTANCVIRHMMFARLAENGQIFTQLPSGLTSLCVLCTNHPGKLRNLNVIKSCESSIKGVFTVCVVFALLKELCQANFYTATSSTYSVELKTDALSFWLIDTFGRKTG